MKSELNYDEVVKLRQTMTVKELASHYGVSEKTMSRRLSEMGLTRVRDRTDINDKDVLSCYQNGMSINDIAKHFQCSHDTITKRLAKYGISHTRAEGIRRHFEPTYEARWDAIRKDLDAGMSVSIVRDRHHIRMDNLVVLMEKHGYCVKNETLLEHLQQRIEAETLYSDKRRTCMEYLLAIQNYIKIYQELPDVFALKTSMSKNVNVIRRAIIRYGLNEFVRFHNVSSWVSVLRQDFMKLNVNYEMNNRSLLFDDSGCHFELDFYLPERRLGIEVNPVGTHSIDIPVIGSKDIYYHQRKAIAAVHFGIGLVHLYDDDFADQMKYRKILNLLTTRKVRKIGARNCEVREISSVESNQFLRTYHLQGEEYSSSYRFGLFDGDALCCVLTLGRPRYTQNTYEVIRYCVRPDYIIMGGFLRLWKRFLKQCHSGDTIVSYLDLNKRFTANNIYEKSGFVLDGMTQPDYVWVNKYGTETLKRYTTTKKKLVAAGFDAAKTEKEIMLERGYVRVYGAGSLRYVYTVNE